MLAYTTTNNNHNMSTIGLGWIRERNGNWRELRTNALPCVPTVSNKYSKYILLYSAVERILQRDKSTANSQKTEDSFSPLHIAAINNHVMCAKLLIDKVNTFFVLIL